MALGEDFEYFVCYYERSAGDFAEMIYGTITKESGSKVYVDHLIRKQIAGRFRLIIDDIIKKCRVFILINTIDSLSRPEVIREVNVAFPNGVMDGHEFWVFKQKDDQVPRSTSEFKERTKIDLSEYTQPEFENSHELARYILSRCKGNYVLSERKVLPPEPNLTKIQTPLKPSLPKQMELNTSRLHEEARKELQNKNYSNSLNIYNQILDISPTDINAIAQRGIVLALLKRFDEAELEFSGGLYLNNRIPELWANKALTQHYRGLNKEALLAINRALDLAPNDKHLCYDKAVILFSLSEFEQAKQWFDRILLVDPDNSVSISGKASALSKLGQKQEAYELLFKAIEKDSNNQNAWYNLGVMYEEDRMYQQALIYFNRATELDPTDYRSFTYKGLIYRRLSRDEDSLKAYDEAIKQNPTNAELYFNKGTCLSLMGGYKESLNYFDTATQLNPKFINAFINKAESLRWLKQFKEAIKTISKILEIDRQDVRALNIMGLIFMEQQKYEEAEEKFREAYRVQQRNIDTILYLIVVLQEQGKHEEALQFCNEGLALEPVNLEFLLNRSHSLIKIKRYQKAIEACDQVLSMDEVNAFAYYNKGCAKALMSYEGEAVPLIQKAISLNNTFKEKAKGDPDLTGLKQNNDFKKLME